MNKVIRSYPCFLPANYRERLKQYQADCERRVEGRGGGAEQTQETPCEQEAEAEQESKTE